MASASNDELDSGCECASGINLDVLTTSAFTVLSAMSDTLRFCDGTSTTDFQVLTPGVPLEPQEGDTNVTLDVTGVVQTGEKLWRVVNAKGDDGTVYHQVSAEDEEALISNAAKANPDVKTSFTRWVSLSKNGHWPEEASANELELFGPHCCISTALLDQKQKQKRARDAASRKRRATGTPQLPASVPTSTKKGKVTITFEGCLDEVLHSIGAAATQWSDAARLP